MCRLILPICGLAAGLGCQDSASYQALRLDLQSRGTLSPVDRHPKLALRLGRTHAYTHTHALSRDASPISRARGPQQPEMDAKSIGAWHTGYYRTVISCARK